MVSDSLSDSLMNALLCPLVCTSSLMSPLLFLISCGGVFQMLSDSMTGSIEGTIRGSIVGRTLVSHNNNSSSGRARPIAGGGSGIGGMISSGLGYSTVSGDEGPRSFRQGPRRSTSPSRDLQSNSGSGAQKEGGKKAISAIDSAFSILPHDEDEDGEELEII